MKKIDPHDHLVNVKPAQNLNNKFMQKFDHDHLMNKFMNRS